MAADYYYADTESGDHIDDPSEDALLMLLECLDRKNNRFLRIRSASNREPSRGSVTRTATGYLVERQGVGLRGTDASVRDDPADVARDLTLWLAGRDLSEPLPSGGVPERDGSAGPILAIGAIIGGLSDPAWEPAINELSGRVGELGAEYSSPLSLRVAFLVPGEAFRASFIGARANRFDRKTSRLVVDIALPERPERDAGLDVRRWLEEAVSVAEQVAQRKHIAQELTELRELALRV